MGHQKVRLHVGDDRKRCNATAKKPWKITGCARSNRARCAYGLIAQLEELLRPKEWVGGSNPSEITFLIFVQNILDHNVAVLSEVMIKFDGKPITIQEHHRLISERRERGHGMDDVLMYSLSAASLRLKIPVEQFILQEPSFAGRFFYASIRKAAKNRLFAAKNFRPYWRSLDNATSKEVGRVEKVLPTDGLLILHKHAFPEEQEEPT